jgi:predicted Zn-dependent protease
MNTVNRFLLAIAIIASSGEGLTHGEIDQRLDGMDLRIAENPGDSMLFLLRSDLHREHRDWEAATSDIQIAFDLEPDNPNIDFYRAVLLRDLGKLPEAERSLSRYLKRAPAWPGAKVSLPKAHQAFAGLLIDQGRPCEAADQYSRALAAAARPGPQLYLSRAEQFVRCQPPDYDAALRGLDEGIARLGPGATVLEKKAIDLELARGSVNRALERIEAQTARAPVGPSTWLRPARILERAGRPLEALEAYRKAQSAIAAMPNRARATRGAEALIKQTEEGIARLEQHTR